MLLSFVGKQWRPYTEYQDKWPCSWLCWCHKTTPRSLTVTDHRETFMPQTQVFDHLVSSQHPAARFMSREHEQRHEYCGFGLQQYIRHTYELSCWAQRANNAHFHSSAHLADAWEFVSLLFTFWCVRCFCPACENKIYFLESSWHGQIATQRSSQPSYRSETLIPKGTKQPPTTMLFKPRLLLLFWICLWPLCRVVYFASLYKSLGTFYVSLWLFCVSFRIILQVTWPEAIRPLAFWVDPFMPRSLDWLLSNQQNIPQKIESSQPRSTVLRDETTYKNES